MWGVRQSSDGADLTLKAIDLAPCSSAGIEDLDGHIAIVPQVGGQEHDRHSPASKLGLDPIATPESRLDLVSQAHGPPGRPHALIPAVTAGLGGWRCYSAWRLRRPLHHVPRDPAHASVGALPWRQINRPRKG